MERIQFDALPEDVREALEMLPIPGQAEADSISTLREIPGCDHTLRFTEQWAGQNDIDIIDLYQFLNAHGGFCDCEVCFNVEGALFDEDRENED